MKITWIGHQSDGTEYGEASIRYLASLAKAGAKLASRSIRYNANRAVDSRIKNFEGNKFPDGCDLIVQHTLPPFFSYSSEAPNLGMFGPESTPTPPIWLSRCKTMDILGIPSEDKVHVVAASGKPVGVFPVPCDINDYLKSYAHPPEAKMMKDEGYFLFYCIGELSKRKNLTGLIRAFYGAFRPDEPVRLLLKSEGSIDDIVNVCAGIRAGLGMSPDDRRICVTTRNMTRDELLGLHAACDVYVQPSCAEWWGINAFDAMAMGKTPIASNTGGMSSYLSPESSWPISTRLEPVYAEAIAVGGLYTVGQFWSLPDQAQLQFAMRMAYEDQTERSKRAGNGLDQAAQFDLAPLGVRMMEVLSAYVQENFPDKRVQDLG